MTSLPAPGWLPAVCLGTALAVGTGLLAHRAASRTRAASAALARHDGSEAPGPLLPPWILILIGAGAAILVAVRFGWSATLPAFLVLVAVVAPLSAFDIAVRKLPDTILASAAVTTMCLFAVADAHTDTWGGTKRAVLAAVILAGAFLVLAVAAGGGFGLGDVKLLAVAGIWLGYLGWPAVATGVLTSFLLAALVGLAAAVRARRVKGATVPLGPAILAGTLLAVLTS